MDPDRLWLVGRVARTFDGRHQITIPAGEVPRVARDGMILTTLYAGDRSSTDLRIYDVVSQTEVRQLTHAEIVTEAVVIRGAFYVVGSAPNGPPWRDHGISVLQAGAGTLVSFTPGRAGKTQWARALLTRSPSGKYIATQLESVDDHTIRTGSPTIEITSLADKATVEVAPGDTNLFAMSDVIVLTRNENVVSAYSRDGSQVWKLVVEGTQAGYVTSDGSRLVQPILQGHWKVLLIDIGTGRIEATYPIEDADWLSPDVSSDRYAIFPSLDGATTYRYLDLETGLSGEAALPVGTNP
jgi:hypothetical protein